MKWLFALPAALIGGVLYFFTSILPTIIGAITGVALGIKEKKKNNRAQSQISETMRAKDERAALKEEVRREMLKEELRAEIEAENRAKKSSSAKKKKNN